MFLKGQRENLPPCNERTAFARPITRTAKNGDRLLPVPWWAGPVYSVPAEAGPSF